MILIIFANVPVAFMDKRFLDVLILPFTDAITLNFKNSLIELKLTYIKLHRLKAQLTSFDLRVHLRTITTVELMNRPATHLPQTPHALWGPSLLLSALPLSPGNH